MLTALSAVDNQRTLWTFWTSGACPESPLAVSCPATCSEAALDVTAARGRFVLLTFRVQQADELRTVEKQVGAISDAAVLSFGSTTSGDQNVQPSPCHCPMHLSRFGTSL